MGRKDVAVKGYDYSQLPKDLSGKLICRAGEIKKCSMLLIDNIVQMGQQLAEAHEDLAGIGQEGQFKPWAEGELQFTTRTAYRYIAAYDYANKFLAYSPQSSTKCDSLSHFTAESMYLLGTDTTPAPAGKEAVTLAGKGICVTKDVAQKLIKKHTAPAPKSAANPDFSPLG